MKRTFVAVVLAVVFVLALAVPAFAQMTHTAAYEWDGVVDFEKQAGHWCNTGAEIKQEITGSGTMSKTQTIAMSPGMISMDDKNDFVAGATPLTVTTVWHLCAPPKVTYDAGLEVDYVMSALELYAGGELFSKDLPWGVGAEGVAVDGEFDPLVAKGSPWDLIDAFDMDALTEQIWAVQVQADSGFSGNLHQDGVAAHGEFGGLELGDYDDWLELTDWTDTGINQDSDTWKYFAEDGAKVGPDFVGSYFDIEQTARTSMGTVSRFIDISSPFNHGYLMEDMSVVGKSDIQETFSMMNAPKGADIAGLWWDLF